MSNDAPFTCRPSGEIGYEILNLHGEVMAWTIDVVWAAIITNALNREATNGPA